MILSAKLIPSGVTFYDTDYFSIVTQSRRIEDQPFGDYFAYLEDTSIAVPVTQVDWDKVLLSMNFEQLCSDNLKRVFYRVGGIVSLQCTGGGNRHGAINLSMRGGWWVKIVAKASTSQKNLEELARQLMGEPGSLDPHLVRECVFDVAMAYRPC